MWEPPDAIPQSPLERGALPARPTIPPQIPKRICKDILEKMNANYEQYVQRYTEKMHTNIEHNMQKYVEKMHKNSEQSMQRNIDKKKP